MLFSSPLVEAVRLGENHALQSTAQIVEAPGQDAALVRTCLVEQAGSFVLEEVGGSQGDEVEAVDAMIIPLEF